MELVRTLQLVQSLEYILLRRLIFFATSRLDLQLLAVLIIYRLCRCFLRVLIYYTDVCFLCDLVLKEDSH